MSTPESVIHVCPASKLASTLARTGARSVVTLLARHQWAGLPSLAGTRHLALDLSDIVAPLAGYVVPGVDHVRDLLVFVRAWDRRAPLLVHCHAGVGRSPAAAYAAACALDPDASEVALAHRLRAASPSATPNPRIVALADAVLGRGGRMVEAVRAIGRGRDCFEGEIFALPVPPDGVPGQMPAYQSYPLSSQ